MRWGVAVFDRSVLFLASDDRAGDVTLRMPGDDALAIAARLIGAVRELRGLPPLTDEERLDFAIGNLEAK